MRDRTSIPSLVVAGTGRGTGKTTVALGLVGALRHRGRAVQTFKVGPDFVDCAYLAHASRRPCRNLDSWMLGRDGVTSSFAHGVTEADCAVIEGTMGVFDGHGGADDAGGPPAARFPGSTAELARLLGAPVVLVIDVAGTAETAAAVALGVRRLDPGLDVIGVILNNVPSDYRRHVVEDAVWSWAQAARPRRSPAPAPRADPRGAHWPPAADPEPPRRPRPRRARSRDGAPLRHGADRAA